MRVVSITKAQAELFVKGKHYSHRMSIFWEAFGLVIRGKIEGVVVYGQPSPAVQKHAFANRNFRLYELTRLVVQTERRNAASFLVGNSLKMLSSQPCAVVSYADTEYGHAGIIYQATNWMYTGSTKSHDHLYMIDGVMVHSLSLRGQCITNPKEYARKNGIKTVAPMLKHRYFMAVGTRKHKRSIRGRLKYPVIKEYPKLPKSMYDSGGGQTFY